jgi:hypothetical protein
MKLAATVIAQTVPQQYVGLELLNDIYEKFGGNGSFHSTD